MNLLTVEDQTAYGRVLHQGRLVMTQARVTAGDLIAARIRAEVDRYNQRMDDYFCGLVQPEGARVAPLGYRLRRSQRIDGPRQVEVALEAFRAGRFMVFIDGYAVDSLDQPVAVAPGSRISFVKLSPLVGG